MFMTTPETTTWISFSKTRMFFEHSFSISRFKHNLYGFNCIVSWYVYLDIVNMVPSETKLAELKAKTLQVMERLGASVDVTLFSEVWISIVCGKHHGDPVI